MGTPFRYRYEGSADTESTVAETEFYPSGPRTEADLLREQAEDRAEQPAGRRITDPED
jgi:hypothetical protein